MTLKNLSAEIGRAHLRRDYWSAPVASLVAWVTSLHHGLAIDWDGDAGENWIALVDGGRVVALLNAQVPLGFVTDRGVDMPYPVVVVSCGEADTVEFSADAAVLDSTFGPHLGESLDREGFSVNDLWYATT